MTLTALADGEFVQAAAAFTAIVESAALSKYQGPADAPRQAFNVHLKLREPFPFLGGYFILHHPDLGDFGPLWLQCAFHPDPIHARINISFG